MTVLMTRLTIIASVHGSPNCDLTLSWTKARPFEHSEDCVQARPNKKPNPGKRAGATPEEEEARTRALAREGVASSCEPPLEGALWVQR